MEVKVITVAKQVIVCIQTFHVVYLQLIFVHSSQRIDMITGSIINPTSPYKHGICYDHGISVAQQLILHVQKDGI